MREEMWGRDLVIVISEIKFKNIYEAIYQIALIKNFMYDICFTKYTFNIIKQNT